MSYTKTALLPVTPDEAFALITQPERLRRWQTVSARVDLRAGGEYRWTVTPGHVAAGTYREVEPGKRVVFGWGWESNPDLAPDASTVTVTLEPAEGGTLVTLVHEGLTDEQAASHAEGWNHYFTRLEKAAADGDAGPDEWAAAPAQLDLFSSADATLAVLHGVLRNLTTEDRTKQTPCSEFDCHALAEHLFGSLTGVGAMAGATVTNPEDGSLENRVADMAAQAIEAWRGRGVEGMVPGPGGAEMPATVGASILSLEFLLHAWDFAQASGQRLEVSDEVVAYVQTLADPIIPPARARGAFADEVTPPADATPLQRLVAFSGRTPVVS
jgi:uncharacterized protein (TIGR03086 family)